jgi:hypothetical protein
VTATDTLDGLREASLRGLARPEEIERAAEVVAAALNEGRPCEVSFAPGNGTRYALLFVSADACDRYVSERDYLESSTYSRGFVFVAWLNGPLNISPFYPVVLIGEREPPHPSYIAEKWMRGRMTADTFVFERLFRLVGERT